MTVVGVSPDRLMEMKRLVAEQLSGKTHLQKVAKALDYLNDSTNAYSERNNGDQSDLPWFLNEAINLACEIYDITFEDIDTLMKRVCVIANELKIKGDMHWDVTDDGAIRLLAERPV
jgi:hypothetical protein